MIQLTINGIPTQAEEGSTILQAALGLGIKIPTLCFYKEINEISACRICVVKVKGINKMITACSYKVFEGMEVETNTAEVRDARKTNLELLLSNHRMDCLSCTRSPNCELLDLSYEYGADQHRFAQTPDLSPSDRTKPFNLPDTSTTHLVRDNSKCILCRRCVSICGAWQQTGVIGVNGRGFEAHIGSPFDLPLNSTSCINCSQCVSVCPTGALVQKDDTDKVWAALADPTKHVVVAPAPSIRAQLGEMFGLPIGTNVEAKIPTACRLMGFDKVFDVDTAADMTIMEEGTEFLKRLQENGPFPMFTSCSPGWVKYLEYYYPDMLDSHLSSVKSPQGIYGSLMKTYYAEKQGIDPKDIYVVSLMPCTAKKFEITRDGNATDYPDIDVVITTVEFSRMLKRSGIDFMNLEDSKFDPIFGIASGAGHIFGATGGVMEAALRTVADFLTGEDLPKVDYTEVRGTKGIKEAEYTIAGKTIRIAVASSPTKAKQLIEMVRSGEREYHFIEIMGCAGGCVGGGGQPPVYGHIRNEVNVPALRASVLYGIDKNSTYRKVHDNPVVKEIYETYLGKPGSHKAEDILHIKPVHRSAYPPPTLKEYLEEGVK